MTNERCDYCRVWKKYCFCFINKNILLKRKLSLIIHRSERWKQSNTGLLLKHLFSQISVFDYGHRDIPFDQSLISKDALILYPMENAVNISKFRGSKRELVILDGSWSQARRMANKFCNYTFVTCEREPWNLYSLRKSSHDKKICTFEASVKALIALGEFQDEERAKKILFNFNYTIEHIQGKHAKGSTPPPLIL